METEEKSLLSPNPEHETDIELSDLKERVLTKRKWLIYATPLPFLLAGLFLLVWWISKPSVHVATLSQKDWLANTTRPFFFKLPRLFYNSTLTPCPIPLALTDDANAADLFIGEIYDDEAGRIDHTVKHWQPTVLFDIEENPLPIFVDTRKNQSKGLETFYKIRVTYEFDAHLTYTYYMESVYKDLRAPPIPFEEKLQEPIAAAIMSNCNRVANTRNEILKELIRRLPGRIYSYGACEHNRDLYLDADYGPDGGSRTAGDWEQTKQQVIRRHKFVLAFENANSVDYVTEKYWDALSGGVVPVYLGAPNLRAHFLPHPKAAIIASEYDTVKDLADHLEYLAGNETAYNEYLEWKTLPYAEPFQTIVDHGDGLPPLCKLALLAQGKYVNPLNKIKSREEFGNVKYPDPKLEDY